MRKKKKQETIFNGEYDEKTKNKQKRNKRD